MVVQRASSRKRERLPVCTVARTSVPIVAGAHPTHVPFPGGEYIFLTLTVYISLAGGTWEVSGRLAGKRARRCLFITQRHASRSRVRMPKIARRQSSHPKPVAGRAPVLPSGTLLFSATSNILIRDYKYALCCSWFIPRCLIPGGILVLLQVPRPFSVSP
jgi:hypothetical protein